MDNDGILEGRWTADYPEDCTRPTAWTGSVAIIREYMEKKESVRYGQCWVFSGLTTTCKDAYAGLYYCEAVIVRCVCPNTMSHKVLFGPSKAFTFTCCTYMVKCHNIHFDQTDKVGEIHDHIYLMFTSVRSLSCHIGLLKLCCS